MTRSDTKKSSVRRRTLGVVVGASALLVAASVAPPAGAYAPASTATVHPGVQTFTAGAQCTANFVFTEGADTYIGQAAHCSGTGAATDTNGCTAASLPLGTPVQVTGASKPGTLAYNSWLTMQAGHETDANTCQYNDLALIKLDPADVAKVNPSIPNWGGPNGVGDATAAGEQVYSYGNSELRGGVTQLSPKTGISLGTTGGGWTHPVYTASPGIPGDSGSAFLDKDGKAIGVLSTLSVAPLPASNNVSDLAHMLAYARAHGHPGLQLVNGDLAFKAGVAGLLRF
jgi:hypothetical protein